LTDSKKKLKSLSVPAMSSEAKAIVEIQKDLNRIKEGLLALESRQIEHELFEDLKIKVLETYTGNIGVCDKIAETLKNLLEISSRVKGENK